MTNGDKFYAFLGLCMRAGKLVTGFEQSIRMIRRGSAVLVITAKDASEGTKKRISDKCAFYEVDCIYAGEKDLLGKHIGKGERTVLTVTDLNFKYKLMKLAGSMDNKE